MSAVLSTPTPLPANRARFSEEEVRGKLFEPGNYLIELVDQATGGRSYELCRLDDHLETFRPFADKEHPELVTLEAKIALMTWRSVPVAKDWPASEFIRTLDHEGGVLIDRKGLEDFLNKHAEAIGIGD